MQWFRVIFSWRVLLASTVIIAGVIFALSLLDQSRFGISHVHISGDFNHISKQAVSSRIATLTKQSFFAVNLKSIKQAITEIPWVDNAAITRQWPDTLLVNIQEKRAVARYNHDGLVDHHGHIFYASHAVVDDALPLLEGSEHREVALWSKYRTWQALLAPLRLSITRLSEPETKSLTLRIDQGFDVILGQSDADTRLRRFVAVYRRLPTRGKENILRVDLRYTKGMSVAWKDGFKPGEMIGHG